MNIQKIQTSLFTAFSFLLLSVTTHCQASDIDRDNISDGYFERMNRIKNRKRKKRQDKKKSSFFGFFGKITKNRNKKNTKAIKSFLNDSNTDSDYATDSIDMKAKDKMPSISNKIDSGYISDSDKHLNANNNIKNNHKANIVNKYEYTPYIIDAIYQANNNIKSDDNFPDLTDLEEQNKSLVSQAYNKASSAIKNLLKNFKRVNNSDNKFSYVSPVGDNAGNGAISFVASDNNQIL